MLALAILALTLAASCSGSGHQPSASSTSGAAVPADAQPPDPCTLLSLDEIRQVTGQGAAQPDASKPADPFTGQRNCIWTTTTHELFISLTLFTDRSIAAAPQNGFPETLTRLFNATDAAPHTDVPDVGTAARFYPNRNTLDVLTEHAYFYLGDYRFEANSGDYAGLDQLAALAQFIVSRLDQIPSQATN